MDNYFVELNNINVNEHVEKKNGLSYLSWAWAWSEVKKMYPDATYTIYENANGWNYHTDGKTCWVKTGVTVAGIEHIEYLPVMDNRNRSIELDKVTSFDVNKAIQRSLTKAVARHGLGLYIYAGEDLPESESVSVEHEIRKLENEKASVAALKALRDLIDAVSGNELQLVEYARQKYGEQSKTLDDMSANTIAKLTIQLNNKLNAKERTK